LQANLDTRVTEFSLSASDLADAILRIGKHFELPVGVEWTRDRQTARSFIFTWRDATVGEMIGSVVKNYPGYSFQARQGVVRVFRQDLLDDKRNFLNLPVPEYFDTRNEISGLTNQRLRSVVQNIVSPRNLPPGAGEGGSYTSGIVTEKPLTITLRGAIVREALDKLVEASEHKAWVVTFSDTRELTSTGFLRTETRWHPGPFPDTDQPMWEFLAWEESSPQ
jgi:hypothetical protein